MPETIKLIMAELKEALEKTYGDKLKKLVLFGSHARGDARPDSDIDFLVVLDFSEKDLSVSREIMKINETAVDLILKYEKTISIIPVSFETYMESQYSFFINVRKEGIAA
ncbi:MAG TPA: nucleotidyltransferase domain-containing protein [Candidatus Wallbacteria bacterium]|nr:nucleotidyltransferase domain-containing protein [Candidatus Wallbacteria bacterium]